MKTVARIFLTLSLLLPTLAFAQSPVITAISPNTGSIAGGTPVEILGREFDTRIVCILPCPTVVLFDDIVITPRESSDTRLLIHTPAHAAGAVNVTVRSGDGRTTTVSNGFTYGGSAAEAQYEKVLVPIYLDGPLNGANGTRWQTDFWIRNNGTTAATLAPWTCPANQVCPAVVPVTRTLQPNETIHNLPAFFRPPTANLSRVVYVTRNEAAKVSMQLRFADASRAELNSGTELPVIRENELHSTTTNLLNVPTDNRFRLMLRVYDVDNTEARFRVNIYGHGEGTSVSLQHSMELTATSPETGEFRSVAAYAQFSLDEWRMLPRLVPLPPALRIEIEPLTPGSRFWAFLSATNNDTQLVTLVTPQ
jgi:hypothetical protein